MANHKKAASKRVSPKTAPASGESLSSKSRSSKTGEIFRRPEPEVMCVVGELVDKYCYRIHIEGRNDDCVLLLDGKIEPGSQLPVHYFLTSENGRVFFRLPPPVDRKYASRPRYTIRELFEAEQAFERGHYVEAANIFREAAQDWPQGLYILGLMHEKGYGVSIDMKRAFDYYQAACDRFVPEAEDRVADFYESGLAGLPVDRNKALEYRCKAEKTRKQLEEPLPTLADSIRARMNESQVE